MLPILFGYRLRSRPAKRLRDQEMTPSITRSNVAGQLQGGIKKKTSHGTLDLISNEIARGGVGEVNQFTGNGTKNEKARLQQH